jgi:hypothetical protein
LAASGASMRTPVRRLTSLSFENDIATSRKIPFSFVIQDVSLVSPVQQNHNAIKLISTSPNRH